jgi:predicted ferric reductase
LKYASWGVKVNNTIECDLPNFAGNSPSSWLWIIVPLIIYIIERITRFIRGLKAHKILRFIIHPSNVLELQIEKNINYSAGQYIYLNYPEIARFEWHPFTITSAPDDPYVSVHIRSAGNWTGKLFQKMKAYTGTNELKIHVDGPYGSCAEDVYSYNNIVLIGAGIGATPYASILKHISNKLRFQKTVTNLNKVYFFWICPSVDTFEWFGEMLKNLENELSIRQDLVNLLEYKIYVTRGWTLRQAQQIAFNEKDLFDLCTGLRAKTNYGRPNFDLFFKELSNTLTSNGVKENVGVFFCGPKELSSQLHKYSNLYSNDTVRFIYNKENF